VNDNTLIKLKLLNKEIPFDQPVKDREKTFTKIAKKFQLWFFKVATLGAITYALLLFFIGEDVDSFHWYQWQIGLYYPYIFLALFFSTVENLNLYPEKIEEATGLNYALEKAKGNKIVLYVGLILKPILSILPLYVIGTLIYIPIALILWASFIVFEEEFSTEILKLIVFVIHTSLLFLITGLIYTYKIKKLKAHFDYLEVINFKV
jgi:hypothetical protein